MSQFFNYPLEVASAAETLCMDWCTKEPVLALSTNDGRISFFQDEVRLPSFIVPDGETATHTLTKSCIAGLRKLGLSDNEEYVKKRTDSQSQKTFGAACI